ncbi:helix-turn-helix domain-containing protein [Pedobacter aquatilis]|uniref:helix-turn-helix domain-containing protein n=1 Tax=Pedobacter aquatilis TaxID=351343 RepID=UPI0025B3122B|nr:helix-turn-helix domain-containing protein [Pedobacter aquatilis]
MKKVNDHRVVNQTKNLLSIIEAANLLGCSRATIYKMIKMRRLNAVNFLGKLTRVRREDILAKFDANFQELSIAEPLKTTKTSTNITEDQSIKNYYSIDELVIIFNKSRTALYTAFARAGVLANA